MKKGKENKPHIGIFGRRNYGKSSFINAVTGQNIAIISDVPGTTTDPIKKSIEIAGVGPVILIDTAGIDDIGELGQKRIEKSINTISTIDLGIIIINNNFWDTEEENLVKQFKEVNIPFFVVHNKSDIEQLNKDFQVQIEQKYNTIVVEFSSAKPNNDLIVQAINKFLPESAYKSKTLIGDLLQYGDIVLLITPIDSAAPEGRLILPQVQLIRDVIDNNAVSIVLKETEVEYFFKTHQNIKPKLVVTDSQIFNHAAAIVPNEIMLTSFSIILARQRGDFIAYLEGTPKISDLQDNSKILILESCTHHVSCDDIGRVKIPKWLREFTGKQLEFDVVSGLSDLQRNIEEYSLVVQCGGCVITAKQIAGRLKPAKDAKIPITNYGMCIAYCMGIYQRAIQPFM